MKRWLRLIKNIIVGLFFALYLGVIIAVSTLLLNKNEYGITQFGDSALIIINKDNANDKYKNGQLVIVESKDIGELKVDEEVFIYKTNASENTVTVISSSIKEINTEEKSPYIVLSVDDSAWGDDFIAGTATDVYDDIGKILSIVQSKWIFFIIFIIPCFFILLYLIYSIVVVIKFESDDLTEEEMNLIKTIENKNSNEEVVEKQSNNVNSNASNDDKIAALMDEINNLKEKINSTEVQQQNENSSENINSDKPISESRSGNLSNSDVDSISDSVEKSLNVELKDEFLDNNSGVEDLI